MKIKFVHFLLLLFGEKHENNLCFLLFRGDDMKKIILFPNPNFMSLFLLEKWRNRGKKLYASELVKVDQLAVDGYKGEKINKEIMVVLDSYWVVWTSL